MIRHDMHELAPRVAVAATAAVACSFAGAWALAELDAPAAALYALGCVFTIAALVASARPLLRARARPWTTIFTGPEASAQHLEAGAVSNEGVRAEREPLPGDDSPDGVDGLTPSEEEREVAPEAEQQVVEKDVVPEERLRLEKDTFTEEAQVSEEVHKERLETDGDAGRV
jgi:hypothetical protein